MLRRQSIQTKLVLSVITLVMAIVFFFTAIAFWQLRSGVLQELHRRAEVIASPFHIAMRREFPDVISDLDLFTRVEVFSKGPAMFPDMVAAHKDLFGIAFVQVSGEILIDRGDSAVTATVPPSFQVKSNETTSVERGINIIVSVPFIFGQQILGSTLLTFSAAGIRAQEVHLIWMAGGICAFFLIVGGLGAYYVGRNIAGPIVDLSSKVGSLHLPDELMGFRRGDEVGILADALVRMRSTQDETLQQLTCAKEELEQRVRERTQELEIEIEERKQAEHAAELANSAKSDFLAKMSHELRTPLNAIIGLSEMLVEDSQDASEDQLLEPLLRIHRAGQRLLALINDILDLSKIEAGMMELYFERIDVRELIRDIAQTVQPMAQRNSVQLEIHCADNVGSIVSDQLRLSQMVLNLLSNACKFTRGGVVGLEVTRRGKTDAEEIVLVVTDSGIGIEPGELQNLFKDFTQIQTKENRRAGGTGLGLSITKKIVELLGGTISVESTPDTGSSFTVILPVIEAQLATSD